MNRVVCIVILAGSLLATAWTCAADEAVVPAYFILVEDHNADSSSVSTPSMILQVAAESDIPKPKIHSVSNQIPNTLDSETGGAISSDNHSNSTAVSQCDHCNNSSNCDQCAGGCNSCGGSDACGHDCCEDCWPQCLHPTWIFKGGALVLDRVSPRSTALVVETGTGRSLMNASGFSFNWNGGVDASLIRRIGDDNLLEVRYFGINNWTAFQRFVTTTPAEIPINPPVPIVPIVLPPPPQQRRRTSPLASTRICTTRK